MSLRRLRQSDIRDLDEKLPVALSKKDDVQQGEDVLLVNDTLAFIDIDGWVPALPLLQEEDVLPAIVVDMGAVRHVTRGADVMRPGITSVPDVEEGGLVVVVDETHEKPLAVGRALVSGDAMRSMSEGRVVENLHFVGDEYWEEFA